MSLQQIEDLRAEGEALHQFRESQVDQMPVVDENQRVVGLVDVQDLLEVRI